MKCSFCGKIIEKGVGKIVVKKDGSIVPLCSSKCEKNMFKLKRNPRKQKWITKRKGDEIVDSFEEKEKMIIRSSAKVRRK